MPGNSYNKSSTHLAHNQWAEQGNLPVPQCPGMSFTAGYRNMQQFFSASAMTCTGATGSSGISSAFQEQQPPSISQLVAFHTLWSPAGTQVRLPCSSQCTDTLTLGSYQISLLICSGMLPKIFSCYSWGKKSTEITLSSSRNGGWNLSKSHSLNDAERDAILSSKRIAAPSNTYFALFS